jgi:hypothetical protein
MWRPTSCSPKHLEQRLKGKSCFHTQDLSTFCDTNQFPLRRFLHIWLVKKCLQDPNIESHPKTVNSSLLTYNPLKLEQVSIYKFIVSANVTEISW